MKSIISVEYQCEICGGVYADVRHALLCESQLIDPCPVKIGDVVRVKNRYETVEDRVVAINIGQSSMQSALRGYKETGIVPIFFEDSTSNLHEWQVATEKDHVFCKDGYPSHSTFPIHHLDIEFLENNKRKLRVSDLYSEKHIEATRQWLALKRTENRPTFEKFMGLQFCSNG